MKLVSRLAAMSFLGLGLAVFGCKSTHEADVTSDVQSQWTNVSTDTKVTTDAAKAVLIDEGLKSVDSASTNVDGKASGKEADGTVVRVAITKEPSGSKVKVTVGTLGDATLGAEIAKKIKIKAEGTH